MSEAPPGQPQSCELFGLFGIFIQGCLGVISVGSLTGKLPALLLRLCMFLLNSEEVPARRKEIVEDLLFRHLEVAVDFSVRPFPEPLPGRVSRGAHLVRQWLRLVLYEFGP